jgi:hypothetical protein
MGFLNKFFGKKEDIVPVKKPRAKKVKSVAVPIGGELDKQVKKPRAKKAKVEDPVLTEKEIAKAEATLKKEPWVDVTGVEIDMDNLGNGAFSLDWNDYFIAKLMRAGYKGSDVEMVDQWFAGICRNIIQENHEQYLADPENRNTERK